MSIFMKLICETYYTSSGDLNGYTINYENMVNLPEEFYEEQKYENYRIQKNDILVSLTGDGNIKCIVVKDDKEILLNQRVAILRAKRKLNINFYYWLLNSNYVKKQFAYFSNGKSQLNISPFDLLNILVPVIDNKVQNDFTKNIKPFEKQINDNILLLKSKGIIIDIILANHFKYNYDKFDALKKKMFYSSFSQYGNNVDTRFSTKFHRPAGEFVYQELQRKPYKKLKGIVSDPISLGASISPKEFDESGIAYYVSMETIKTYEVELDDTQRLSPDYFEKNRAKTIQKDDIIIARSGVSIGKTAIIKEDFDGIFADFTMRIRIDKTKYIPLFAYYFFRSKYFQYLIEINKKGLQNQNIFPINIQEFPIPDILLSEQQKIVDMINTEIDKQKEIENQIDEKKSEIEKMINALLK